MIPYPFDDIEINGRLVGLEGIVNHSVKGQSTFEEKTFEFISGWMLERESFVQSTSGSTGTPKQITITRKQMTASATMSIEALGLKSGYNALLCIHPDFIGGKMMLVRSIIGGMRIIASTPSANPFNKLHSQRIDFAAMVPYQIEGILQSDERFKFNEIKKIIVGGASVHPSTEKKLQDYSCIFYSTYGMTETISHIALRQLNGKNPSDFYRTLPGIHIYTDERSCLVIEWEELGQKVVTNDIVEIADSDHFRWIGRWDNVINTGGAKVFPENVELKVREIFARLNIPNSFFVGSLADAKLGNKVTLFIEGELRDGMVAAVEQEISRHISKIEAPKQLVLIKSFVLTENGKINRHATAKPYIGDM